MTVRRLLISILRGAFGLGAAPLAAQTTSVPVGARVRVWAPAPEDGSSALSSEVLLIGAAGAMAGFLIGRRTPGERWEPVDLVAR